MKGSKFKQVDVKTIDVNSCTFFLFLYCDMKLYVCICFTGTNMHTSFVKENFHSLISFLDIIILFITWAFENTIFEL